MFIQKITNKYDSAKIPCCNEQCKIRIDTGKNFVMLKGELLVPAKSKKMCDCVIFQNDKNIVIIELKSESINASEIIEKFSNSGKKSISIATSFEPKSNFRLHFILLAKKYSNFFAHDELKRSKININGKKYDIILDKCGGSLKKIMSD